MSGSPEHEIGIVNYPGAQVACILGLTDLFGIASTIALDQRQSPQTALRVTHWKAVDNFDTNLSIAMPPVPHWFPYALAHLSLPKRVWWAGSRLPHIKFARRHWRGGGFLSWVDLSLFLVEKILGPVIRVGDRAFRF